MRGEGADRQKDALSSIYHRPCLMSCHKIYNKIESESVQKKERERKIDNVTMVTWIEHNNSDKPIVPGLACIVSQSDDSWSVRRD